MDIWKRGLDPRYFIDECIDCLSYRNNRVMRRAFLQVLRHEILIHNRDICPFCGAKKKRIYVHIRRTHIREAVSVCIYLYTIANKMVADYIVKRGGCKKPYRCKICNKTFSSAYEIFKHLIFEHFKDEICRCLPRYTVWCKQ